MKTTIILLGLILTCSANAETLYFHDKREDGSSTTTRVSCNDYTNSCSARAYENSSADNRKALAVGLAASGLT